MWNMNQHSARGPHGHPSTQRLLMPAQKRRRYSKRCQKSSTRCATAALLSLALLGDIGVQAQNTSSTNGLPIPLVVTNNCPDTIWPGIGTQGGTGPGIGGFELKSGSSQQLYVSSDWQGRLWGRTNCSFNANGTGPSQLDGVNGAGAACLTGDCFGRLDCEYTGAVPSTLAEFLLQGGVSGTQTFYDISLVDGYNIPVGIVYIPAKNTTWIPPNLVNPSCIATSGFLWAPARSGETYTTPNYPMPWEPSQTNSGVRNWCPWDLQAFPPAKPGDGVYPYPDDNIVRPIFDPCQSACTATNNPEDCCTGDYNSPDTCPHGLYSTSAKAVCPDAYSYAFDDQTSTFIIPSGGGFQVVFCPEGRSTNILATFGSQLQALASGGSLTTEILDAVTNITYIDTHGNGSPIQVRSNFWAVMSVATMIGLWLAV